MQRGQGRANDLRVRDVPPIGHPTHGTGSGHGQGKNLGIQRRVFAVIVTSLVLEMKVLG
jgi:hypothetical protein